MRSLFLEARRRRREKGERGVAMIEFSVAAGILVLILLGLFSYGEVLVNYVELKYAVGELSRQVAVGEDPADRQSRFNAARTQIVQESGFDQGCVSFPAPSFASGRIVVTGTYSFTASGCRTMPDFFLPTPDSLTARNEFVVP